MPFLRNVSGLYHCFRVSHIYLRLQPSRITSSYCKFDTGMPDLDGEHGALYKVAPSDKGRLRIHFQTFNLRLL